MIPPKITVVTRLISSDDWPNGFPVHCLKFSDGTYSNEYRLDETFKENLIYEGECPSELRILPYVDPKYLLGYMQFYSQIIPRKINPIIAKAVRSCCPVRNINVYDSEAYHPNGKIISSFIYKTSRKEGVYEYLTSLLKKEDRERIEHWEPYIEDWGEMYSKEC